MQEHLSQDDVLFDRLVDGELSPAERRRLLASLDERPGGWRKCALAFLEAQSWAGDFGRLVAGSDERGVAESKVALADATEGATAVRKARSQRRVAWLAIAAAVMVALTVAFVVRDRGKRFAADGGAQIADVVRPPTSADVQRVDDAITLWVRDETGTARPLRVPLVDAESLDRQLGLQFRTGVPDELRHGLRERGFDVQSKRRYAPLWLDNGRPMIVPVEDTKIVPVGRSVY